MNKTHLNKQRDKIGKGYMVFEEINLGKWINLKFFCVAMDHISLKIVHITPNLN